jgi:hypothetical protein
VHSVQHSSTDEAGLLVSGTFATPVLYSSLPHCAGGGGAGGAGGAGGPGGGSHVRLLLGSGHVPFAVWLHHRVSGEPQIGMVQYSGVNEQLGLRCLDAIYSVNP